MLTSDAQTEALRQKLLDEGYAGACSGLGAMLQVAVPEVLWSLVWSPLVWLLFQRIYRRVGGTRLA